jgi:glycogen operon protein
MLNARYYAYSIDGPASPGGRFDLFQPKKVLLDPYARAVFFPVSFQRAAALGPGSNAGMAPVGVLLEDEPFDWTGDRRPLHDSDLVIYEIHVRGFTMNPNSGVSPDKHGTFLGVRHGPGRGGADLRIQADG